MTTEEKKAILAEYGLHESDTGSPEAQVALLTKRITGLTEHRSVPWDALPGRMVVDETGEWRMREHPERLPLSYTLRARKPAA